MQEQPEKIGGFSEDLSGEQVNFGPGFAISVTANQNANIDRAGGLIISAGGDADIMYGGALLINAGGDLEQQNGGAGLMNIGGNAEITNGGAWMVNTGKNLSVTNGGMMASLSQQSSLENCFVGVLLSGETNLGEGTKVLLNTPQAIALGAAMGATFAILRWLFRK